MVILLYVLEDGGRKLLKAGDLLSLRQDVGKLAAWGGGPSDR